VGSKNVTGCRNIPVTAHARLKCVIFGHVLLTVQVFGVAESKGGVRNVTGSRIMPISAHAQGNG